MRLLWWKLSPRKGLAITLSLNCTWELEFSMLTPSQSLYGLLFMDWIAFMLHLSHPHSYTCSQIIPPSLPKQSSIYLMYVRPPGLFWIHYFHLCLYGERNWRHSEFFFLYLIVSLFSFSTEKLPSHQVNCNTGDKDQPNPAYSHSVISFRVFLPSFNV